MKLIALLLLPTIFCFTQCKKDSGPLNIVLYDKPLNTIQSNIQGKWKLQYEKGGICGNCTHYFDNFFWEFNSTNRVRELYNDVVIADTTIVWIKDKGVYINGAYTFIMNFSDKRGVPWNYVVDGIFSDTLLLHDNSSDPIYYHFTKPN